MLASCRVLAGLQCTARLICTSQMRPVRAQGRDLQLLPPTQAQRLLVRWATSCVCRLGSVLIVLPVQMPTL